MKVDNAVILAAGLGERFAPLSYERHKALTVIKGEILIERQIKQLIKAGVPQIFIVVGYKADQFIYLKDKYGVELINNPDYLIRNNNSSIWYAKDILRNSYICSSDNYYEYNPFSTYENESYYTAQYAEGFTNEWCMQEDRNGNICSVTIGNSNSWYMLGHAFWSEEFSKYFIECLTNEYDQPETYSKLWESILVDHLDVLKMKIKKYDTPFIYEFDSLDELRQFDNSYYDDTRSQCVKSVCRLLDAQERDIVHITPIDAYSHTMTGFEFDYGNKHYRYTYASETLEVLYDIQ